MKKWFYFMMLAIVPAIALSLSSCDNDSDLPDVSFSMQISGGEVVDGSIYVVQGDTLKVTSLSVANTVSNKPVAIPYATYYWDYRFVGTTNLMPYQMSFATSEFTPVGNHLLEISCPVLELDKSMSTALLAYPVKVVSSADQIPGAGAQAITAKAKVSDTSN